jgi:hypothetical protein
MMRGTAEQKNKGTKEQRNKVFRSQESEPRTENREPVRAYSYTRQQSFIDRSRGMTTQH